MTSQAPLGLPPQLIAAIREGRAVLFLGAGASRGATDQYGTTIPAGDGLARNLRDTFLGAGYENLSFRQTYDLACSQRDVRTVQRHVFETLKDFAPADFHLLIPTFAWSGILTTNYDLVIERAYQKAVRPVQRLSVNTRDGDSATDALGEKGLLYVKLHGCITRHQEVDPPLIASTDQLINFKGNREGQFATFLEWAKTKTMIFCGYAFLDDNLRTLFGEIIKEGDNRPMHFIINKDARSAEIAYWASRRVTLIDCPFSSFINALDQSITPNERVLASLPASLMQQTTFHRFITVSNVSESDELKSYFASFIDHVGPDLHSGERDPKSFYKGFDLGWYPILTELDVKQSIVDEMLIDVILRPHTAKKPMLTIIKGHAGSGKTITLRRLCYDAASKHDKLCFFVGRSHLIIPDMFEEIARLTNLPIFLFLDNIADHREKTIDLIAWADKKNIALHIIAAETYNNWNVACEDLERYVSSVHEMRYLSEGNIKALIQKLTACGSLGYLETRSPEAQVHELRNVHGRQLLVALLEATHGVPLVNIISDEYKSIKPALAQRLYLDICSLHRFGPPVRAGLISRIHNISFEDFREKLFKPLEKIVVLRTDKKSGDYVYEARHSYIAHAVYEDVIQNEDEKFDNIVRIVSKLNPSFSYDMLVITQMLKAGNLERALSDHAKIRQVYDAAQSALGERAILLHQRGIFEMHIANNAGGLDVAERLIEQAIELEPFNKSIKHSLAESYLRRSRMAEDPLQREAWRNSAIEKASALTSKGSSPYPHHTLLKAAIDNVREALTKSEDDPSEAATQHLGDCIASAETTLKRGLQAFPNEAILLAEEGELSNVLSAAKRAETAFEKAFLANPRSTLIAKRLSRIKRAKGLHAVSHDILRKCIEFNPGAQDLHYALAEALIESAPNGDQIHSDVVAYHLRRSFSPNDNNLQAQFWYARQLAICGKYDEAKPFFKRLGDARVPFKEKKHIRGIVLEASGSPKRYVGSIIILRDAFCFVECPALGLSAFLALSDIAEHTETSRVGTSLTYELGFNLLGPAISRVL